MAYIAQKSCSFAGQRFRIGETIPTDLITPGAIKRLLGAGVIAESGGFLLASPDSLDTVTVSIIDEHIAVELTTAQLIEVAEIVQANEDDIIAFIQKITSEEQLMLIDAIVKSDAVFTAAADRANQLKATEEGNLDPEQFKEWDYQSLKKFAKDMGLSTAGTKETLIDRISAEKVKFSADTEGEAAAGEQ